MERPSILNVRDFFIIGIMALIFFLMLDVIGAGIVTFQGWRANAAPISSQGG